MRVLNEDSIVLFEGDEDSVVKWLEDRHPAETELLWVFIVPTGDIITASQFLDLAT